MFHKTLAALREAWKPSGYMLCCQDPENHTSVVATGLAVAVDITAFFCVGVFIIQGLGSIL